MSSFTPDEPLEPHDAPKPIFEDEGDSVWETATSKSEPSSPDQNPPEPDEPQNSSDKVTIALDEIRDLYADPVTDSPLPCEPSNIYTKSMISPEEIGPPLPRPGMQQKLKGCAGPTKKDAEYKIAELGLYRIRKSQLRKAIKDASSPMLASLKREDAGEEDEPTCSKRQRLDPPRQDSPYPGDQLPLLTAPAFMPRSFSPKVRRNSQTPDTP